MKTPILLLTLAALGPVLTAPASAQTHVYLLEVPDYNWHYGCFGTACGNLLGFWDRNGLPNLYQGPLGNGLAPLGDSASIHTLWASQAGYGGRPADQPGHVDDYWRSFESTGADPYLSAQRPEHAPDCINDFTGLNQLKWTNLNGECDGNIDGYGFVFWETNGLRRTNFQPLDHRGVPIPDLPSGLRNFARHIGYDADSFSQLADFNPHIRPSSGFTFENLKAEIDAGYPVLIFLQNVDQFYREAEGRHVNPIIHGMLAYGYREDPSLDIRWVYYRTSWASGNNMRSQWGLHAWQASLPVRGFIGFHPHPKITELARTNQQLTLSWHGPAARLYDALAQTTNHVHSYSVEWTPSLRPPTWIPIGNPSPQLTATFAAPTDGAAFYRVTVTSP